jgi:zinc/manganese transport system substrate-binding protein/manganese/iron transport system substrate-binding protein
LPALALVAAAVLALVTIACGEGDGDGANGATPETGTVRAVTSLEVFADLVRNVGGDRVSVQALLPSGADPHTYELPPSRVKDVAAADIVFINGLGLEEGIEDVITQNADGPVVELAAGLRALDEAEEHGDREGAQEESDDHGHSHDAGNPHLWLDVRNAIAYVERIRDELIDLDPQGRAVYEANASAYIEELEALDAEFAAIVETIPAERRKIVTYHDAFPYLAERYGLEVVAVVVPSPGQETSAQDVARLTRLLREEDVPAVFTEPQADNTVLELAAQDAGVPVYELLSGAYAHGVDSYTGLMRFNMEQLQEALGEA